MSLTRTDIETAGTTREIIMPAPTDLRAARRRRRGIARGEESGGVAARGASKWFVLTGLILFTIYSIGPAWWLIVSATKSREQLYTTNGLWFADFRLIDNIVELFKYENGSFGLWLWNSVLYATAGSIGQTIIALAAGYGLAMYQYRGKGTSMAFVIGSFLIPGALLTVPSYLLFVQLGLFDTIWSMIIPAFFGPFSVYLAKVYAEGAVPQELLEAARIDGAGEYRTFFSIGLRLLTTAGATIFLLHFVAAWNSFYGPLIMLRDRNLWPVMLGLYSWLGRGTDSEVDVTTLVITGSLVATIPMVLLLVAMQRYWRAGVTMGSLK
ncbi:carbohydrate ABC transporter permease [Sinomonas sp. JGH33]|uniref:Carbohydrate ABC transporter permease n=1 Tax=Sinomonas terricola TaxID=3110330 RepID=A0ABU5T6E1_9MICC|nr:carbohydrate ABC transporter permease [Sinomonas sp. JGH33]MEA5455238.1 carbohydrate ABC transporter permease [Sinomonas sp. JGH33]